MKRAPSQKSWFPGVLLGCMLKRFAANEHTYVEVVDAAGAGGSPKSVIIQSRRTGPMFSGIACRPCK